MSRRQAAALLALGATLLAVPTTAGAEVIAGSARDGPGGGDNAQQDIRVAALLYDTTGILRGAATLAEVPVFSAFGGVAFDLGAWEKSTGQCRLGATVDVFPPDPEFDDWFSTLTIGDAEDGPSGDAGLQGTTVEFQLAADQAAGQSWSCAEVVSLAPLDTPGPEDQDLARDTTKAFSLTAQAAQQPTAAPDCALRGRRVRRGGKARLRCSHVRGRVTVRVYRGTKLRRAATVKLRAGRASVSMHGLRRGAYRVQAWQGPLVFGEGTVRVR